VVERVGDRNVGTGTKRARLSAGEFPGEFAFHLPQYAFAQRNRGVLEMAGDDLSEPLEEQLEASLV